MVHRGCSAASSAWYCPSFSAESPVSPEASGSLEKLLVGPYRRSRGEGSGPQSSLRSQAQQKTMPAAKGPCVDLTCEVPERRGQWRVTSGQ